MDPLREDRPPEESHGSSDGSMTPPIPPNIGIPRVKHAREKGTTDKRDNPFRTPSLLSLSPAAWLSSRSSGSSGSLSSSPPTSEPLDVGKYDEKSVPAQGQESEDDSEKYLIKQLAERDDIDHMPRYKRNLGKIVPYLAFLSTGAFWTYFVLRVIFTRSAEKHAGKIFAMAWVFIGTELGIAGPMILHRFWQMMGLNSRLRPKLRLQGPNVPLVDVIITCCGEDTDLVLDTAKAACDIDYPADRFRVFVCDDGKSEDLRKAVEGTAKHQFPNLNYRSRPKYPGVPHHAKAGNLNYALEETKKMPGGAYTYFAALDADMIPEKPWLRALMPHLIRDKKCAMSCPPQLFYNVPDNDPLSQCLDIFVHVSEPIKDAMGVAWCTGSGYVLRREAIDHIGGFPIGSLAEDVCCSSMLLGMGWNTAFVHEPLQWGTVPESLTSHLKQRTRWTVGTIQTAVKLRFCIWGPLVKKMTFFQRMCGFVYTVSAVCTIFLVASMLTVPIVLISGGNLVPFANYFQLKWLVRSCFVQVVLGRLEERFLYLPAGYRIGQRDQRAMMWMAPYHAISIIRSFLLPKWLGGKIAVFTSSGSQKCELDERDPAHRAPLHRRLKVTLWDCNAYLHLLYILFVLVAVLRSTYEVFFLRHNVGHRATAIDLLTHAGWPPLLWILATLSCWTPIQYALFPPKMPPREDLLVRDPKTGVAHPTKEAKIVRSTMGHGFFEFMNSTVSIYTGVVFVLSFWL